MRTTESEGAVQAALYARDELPPPAAAQVEEMSDRLEVLVSNGTIDDYHRSTWVKRTPVDDCADSLRDLYLSFTAWANEHDRTLVPFFQTRECYSADVGGHEDWLVLPAMCLAVYRDGELSAVYPHTDGSETRTVGDGVAALERGQVGHVEQRPALAD